jgi:hypothetical protein
VIGRAERQPPRTAIHYIVQELVAQEERDLDLPHSGLGLRVGQLEAATLEDRPGDQQVHHLANPKARESKCRDHRPTAETLAVRWRLGFDLGGGVEQGVKLIDLEERNGPCASGPVIVGPPVFERIGLTAA